MTTHTLKSGNTLEIHPAEFDAAWAFTQAVAAELATSNAKIDLQGADVGALLGLVCKLIASKTVYAALWPCATKCLYNSNKVTKEVFDDPEARKDFLPIVVELFKENVVPFIGGLDLSSLTGPAPS